MKKLIFIVLFFFYQNAFACMNNFDCDFGQMCVKANGNIGMDGVCVTPMNQYGQPSNRIPTPSAQPTVVPHCMYDTQCGINGQCVKQGGDMYGICMQN